MNVNESVALKLWQLVSRCEPAIEELSDNALYGAMYLKLEQLGLVEIADSGREFIELAQDEMQRLVAKFGLHPDATVGKGEN